MNNTDEKIIQIRNEIELMRNEFKSIFNSSTIPREVEMAFRERLGVDDTEAFPVGSIFVSVVSTNPSTLLGYGTWTAFATGRTIVGIDAGQTEFDTVEETGGEKTHTLVTSEMPAHVHSMGSAYSGAGSSNGNALGGLVTNVNTNTQSTGGDGAHNNLQPYIVVYMWKRTA